MKKLTRLAIEVSEGVEDEAIVLSINGEDSVLISKSKQYTGMLCVVFIDENIEFYVRTIGDALSLIEGFFEGYVSNWGKVYDILYQVKFGKELF